MPLDENAEDEEFIKKVDSLKPKNIEVINNSSQVNFDSLEADNNVFNSMNNVIQNNISSHKPTDSNSQKQQELNISYSNNHKTIDVLSYTKESQQIEAQKIFNESTLSTMASESQNLDRIILQLLQSSQLAECLNLPGNTYIQNSHALGNNIVQGIIVF